MVTSICCLNVIKILKIKFYFDFSPDYVIKKKKKKSKWLTNTWSLIVFSHILRQFSLFEPDNTECYRHRASED